MNVQHLGHSLSNIITDSEQQKRKQMLGLHPFLHTPPLHVNISQLITTHVVEPVTNDIARNTGFRIEYQHGTATGYYYLKVNRLRFAILYVPNPSAGTIMIKFLNKHGQQCTPPKRLVDTIQIIEYLKDFSATL